MIIIYFWFLFSQQLFFLSFASILLMNPTFNNIDLYYEYVFPIVLWVAILPCVFQTIFFLIWLSLGLFLLKFPFPGLLSTSHHNCCFQYSLNTVLDSFPFTNFLSVWVSPFFCNGLAVAAYVISSFCIKISWYNYLLGVLFSNVCFV